MCFTLTEASLHRFDPPSKIVVMGVSGCGKTTVGMALAARLQAVFIDGDDLHPASNIARMSRGVPLDPARPSAVIPRGTAPSFIDRARQDGRVVGALIAIGARTDAAVDADGRHAGT
jgi:cytidylate kinase